MLSYDSSPIATLEEVGGSSSVKSRDLAIVRAFFALTHLIILIYVGAFKAIKFDATYKTELGTRLKKETIYLSGPIRLYSFFTAWTYWIQGIFFALGAWCSAADAGFVRHPGPQVVQLTHYSFELSTGCSLLVTVVVTFVIWPEMVKGGVKTADKLANFHDFMMHNITLLEVVSEILLGRIPMYLAHLPFSVFWGLTYIIFSWMQGPRLARMAAKGDKKLGNSSQGNGANFMYFFLDWTLPTGTLVASYTGLVTVLSIFYTAALGLATVEEACANLCPLWLRAILAYSAASLLTKWKD